MQAFLQLPGLCFEYDHIIPYSKGGESVAGNCQILQTRVNRYKSNQDQVAKSLLRGYSCDVKFTGVVDLTPLVLSWSTLLGLWTSGRAASWGLHARQGICQYHKVDSYHTTLFNLSPKVAFLRHADGFVIVHLAALFCIHFKRLSVCWKSDMLFQFADKELDIIEMAVYGDVVRPGNQCRCKTVAEMLRTYKSKDHMAACKLPSTKEPF
ncbi:hypothetical protein RJ639_000766 [Escallonia herrerae]|uniref:HNH nuclease domain-containing protein n=1 Tax=Escallonia herrerae TaxID=1293975 RepID=A0AA88XA69_9ASTE|nr:hypothetical protein RJ639_000766 [Escallonia herrerae]